MALFTPTDLQRLSDVFQRDFLTDSCAIGRESRTTSAMGGKQTSTWPTVATSPCAIIAEGLPQEQVVAAQTVGSILKIVLLPRGTDVRGSDQLTINGLAYHVIDLYEPSTFEVIRRVLVRQLTL